MALVQSTMTIDPLIERCSHWKCGRNCHGIHTYPNGVGGWDRFVYFECFTRVSVQITRLARGVTSGSFLEFTNREILADALSGRQRF